MVELFINGYKVDLIGSEEIAIDYAMFSIDDISKRKGVRSYKFKLPKTQLNRTILEVNEEVSNLSQLPYTRMTASLNVGGIDIGIKFCELTSANDFYNISLYGGNSFFFDSIKDKKLIDLDLERFDHYWNYANVFNSRTNTEGYIYPLIDYGEDDSTCGNVDREINPRYMMLSVFADDILNQIFSETGYTFTNTLSSDTNYASAKLLIPAHRQVRGNFFAPKKYNATFRMNADRSGFLFFGLPITLFDVDTAITYAGNYYTIPYSYDFIGGGASTTSNGLSFQDNITFTLTLTLQINNPSSAALAFGILTIYSDANTGQFPAITVPPGINTITFTLDYTINGNTPLQFGIYGVQGSGVAVDILAGSTLEISNATIIEQNVLTYGNFITISSILPDMKQSDFIKNYMQLYGLIPIIDDELKTIRFEKFNTVEESINEFRDWSGKIDLTDSEEVSYLVDEYAQRNAFKYTVDGDEKKPIGTDGYIAISNQNLELEKDVVELDYAGTYTIAKLKNMTLPKIGVFVSGEFTKDKEPRLLLLYYKDAVDFTDTSALKYNDGTDDDTITTGFPMARFIDSEFDYNLGFGANILNLYYRALNDVLDNYKMVKCNLRLTALDINQLDFTKPVFIQYFNSYFYVNKIVGYRPASNNSTQVELVKIF